MAAGKIVAAVVIAALVGLIVWLVIAQNRWNQRCAAAGGQVEERFEGYITTYIQVGNTQVPQLTPQYSYHCWVDGREVNV